MENKKICFVYISSPITMFIFILFFFFFHFSQGIINYESNLQFNLFYLFLWFSFIRPLSSSLADIHLVFWCMEEVKSTNVKHFGCGEMSISVQLNKLPDLNFIKYRDILLFSNSLAKTFFYKCEKFLTYTWYSVVYIAHTHTHTRFHLCTKSPKQLNAENQKTPNKTLFILLYFVLSCDFIFCGKYIRKWMKHDIPNELYHGNLFVNLHIEW